ncbi:maestro heat-like repeat family member 5 [Numida meleagris]|uniref:maestro heat-like repeat family member 5 n=1 Tax=Numida meleagris TaxID=8996 RepID=UPI000B3DF322|nr:maestro heat-like repeat family member 5 [Numida meleagris]
MERKPPRSPRVAWEKSGAPQERRPPPEPYQVTEVQPLHADADWLHLCVVEEVVIDGIKAYINSTEKDLVQKMQFLNCIITLCSTARNKGLTEGLDVFCHRNKLAENVEVLMCEEPREQLCTALRYHTMNAIAALSSVKAISEDEIVHLLNICFNVIFCLPPKESLNICLYNHTLHAMDNMLKVLLDSHPSSSIHNQLQSILEVLLPFTVSQSKTVCERALNQMWKLSGFMTKSFWQQPVGKNLHPSQRTKIVLMTLEKIIGDYSFDEKKWAETVLDMVLRDPGTWLIDVPEILRSIHRNLEINTTSLQQTLLSLLDVLTNRFPRDALMSVLTDLPQSDSTTLDIWKRMLSLTGTSERILEELRHVLQDPELCGVFNITTEDSGLLSLTMMHPTDEILNKLCNPALLQRCLKTESLPILWLALRGLGLLSERPETAREIWALLPDIMETLQFANMHIVLKVLNICRLLMSYLGKREASPIALKLAQKLLPLFNHVSSEVRECSIRLFKDVTEAAVWWKKGTMKKNVRRGLLPLLFHMSDETPSVAQASRETLVACAKCLKWKELKHKAREENIVGIRKCLLQQDRSRVEGYLWQSLPYLKDSQASLRSEAVKFIGLALQHSWDQTEEKLNEICSALQPLEDDADPAVCNLARGTILMLSRQRQQASSARSRLAALWCWL